MPATGAGPWARGACVSVVPENWRAWNVCAYCMGAYVSVGSLPSVRLEQLEQPASRMSGLGPGYPCGQKSGSDTGETRGLTSQLLERPRGPDQSVGWLRGLFASACLHA